MTLSIIAAVAANGVIGREGALPWRLPADLRRFKRLTTGHHLIMGRRTFASLAGPLPGREIIVLSRDGAFRPEGVAVARSLDAALELTAGDGEPFVGGGEGVYRLALDRADRIYLTRIHAEFEGDTRFPDIDPGVWRLVEREGCDADERNPHPYSFLLYIRR